MANLFFFMDRNYNFECFSGKCIENIMTLSFKYCYFYNLSMSSKTYNPKDIASIFARFYYLKTYRLDLLLHQVVKHFNVTRNLLLQKDF